MFDVITIGTATRDVFLKSPYFKVLKDPNHLKSIGFKEGVAECFAFGSKIDVSDLVFAVGGGAANAAVTFARQGLRAGAIVSVGDDFNGEAIISSLKQEKVSVFPSVSKKNPTAYSTLLLSENGERTVLVSRGAANDLEKKQLPLSRLQAKWVYLSPGAIPTSVINSLVDHFVKHGAKVAINPSGHYLQMGVTKLMPILQKSSVVILNRSEASELTRVNYDNEREIFRRFNKYVNGIAVMTDGPSGVLVSDGQSIFRAGIIPEKKLVDRTGAGDAFGAGFVAALASKNALTNGPASIQTIEYAIRLASANATAVVEQIGAQAGVLTNKDFNREARWKRLAVRRTIL